MRTVRLLVCAALFVLFPLVALGENRVSGTFTVKGKSTAFKHAYAFWKTRMMDESKVDLYVLLSDEVVTPAMLPRDDDGVGKMADHVRAGTIHALELHFDGAAPKLFEAEQGAVYHDGIAPARQGVSGALQFTPSAAPAGTLSGKVSLDAESAKLLGWNAAATFQVTIPPKK